MKFRIGDIFIEDNGRLHIIESETISYDMYVVKCQYLVQNNDNTLEIDYNTCYRACKAEDLMVYKQLNLKAQS